MLSDHVQRGGAEDCQASNSEQGPANDMQENPNAIPEGETPHNVTLLCYDPLVDVTKPGDRITVTGVLHQ